MPIGRLGSSPSNSVPDLNELDSNPQSVANATGDSAQTGGIGHRAVQFLRNISSSIREVADSFANAIETRFSGSAKDNLKSLFNRGPRQIETPPTASNFRSYVGGEYAQIDQESAVLENQTYGSSDEYAVADNLAQSYEPTYAALSEVRTQSPAQDPTYQNISSKAEVESEDYVAGEFASDDYIEAAPEEIYASLAEISTEPLYAQLSDITVSGYGDFKPDTTQPADSNFYKRVDSNSSPATRQALGFIKKVIDQHGAAGGKALADAGIFRNKKVIGQVTPELFNAFQLKLKEAKAANAAKVAEGFAPSASELKYEKYNSDNADSPVHAVLQKAVFINSPKLSNKVKWEFDQILARGASGASPLDLAKSVARQVVSEKLKESYDAGRSDSPLHPLLAKSALANESNAKLERIKAEFDNALFDAAVNYAYDGGLDKPFNPDAFKDLAIAAAKATIEKYTF